MWHWYCLISCNMATTGSLYDNKPESVCNQRSFREALQYTDSINGRKKDFISRSHQIYQSYILQTWAIKVLKETPFESEWFIMLCLGVIKRLKHRPNLLVESGEYSGHIPAGRIVLATVTVSCNLKGAGVWVCMPACSLSAHSTARRWKRQGLCLFVHISQVRLD